VLAARAKVRDRFDTTLPRTLDGAAFMRTAVARENDVDVPLAPDAGAIRWVLESLDGTHVFAEANTAPVLYGWEGRYSVFTGNPTVVGWDWHQRQQRPPMAEEVQKRVAELQRAYRTTDATVASRVLNALGADGVGRYWSVAYWDPEVAIYRLEAPATS
jgi:uncharacterized membrane protein